MQKLKILIVEDELLIAESLKSMLANMDYEVAAMYRTGQEAIDKFYNGFADIIIMDIHLSGKLNGIETSIEIRKVSTAPIIFLTNNIDEYLRKKAIFDIDTVQYVTKPFTRLDISIAIDLSIKAIRSHELKLQKANSSSYLINNCIFVKESQSFRKVMIDEILFLRADGSYCKLYFRSDPKSNPEHILFSENLSYLEEKLAFANSLLRIHRSYIINTQKVNKIQDNRLWIDEHEIPVGKTYKNEIADRFRLI